MMTANTSEFFCSVGLSFIIVTIMMMMMMMINVFGVIVDLLKKLTIKTNKWINT